MEGNYPCFENREIRREYSEIIDNLFKRNNFNWEACLALYSPYVFVRRTIDTDPFQLSKEWNPLPNIARIGINTKEGVLRLGIFAYPPMNLSYPKKILEENGYTHEDIEGQPGLSLLVKPLDNLESLVGELRKIEPILLGECKNIT